jgi:hypothetical protein
MPMSSQFSKKKKKYGDDRVDQGYFDFLGFTLCLGPSMYYVSKEMGRVRKMTIFADLQ